MPYAILRFSKRKAGGVIANYAHNERKKEAYKSNPDIDTERSNRNYHFVQPGQPYRKEVNRLIAAAGCKVRSNSTVMVETLITASPEFMSALPPPEQREYFSRAFDFMAEKIGKDNIISAVVHMDERTPHTIPTSCPVRTPKRGLRAARRWGRSIPTSVSGNGLPDCSKRLNERRNASSRRTAGLTCSLIFRTISRPSKASGMQGRLLLST